MLTRLSARTCRPLAKSHHLLCIAVLLAMALGTAPTPPIQAGPAAPSGAVSPEGLLRPDGTLDLSTGFEGTLDLSGWEVTLDGERGPVLSPHPGSAAPSGATWYSLSNDGLESMVFALTVVGSDLYVGGGFSQTGDGALTHLGHIARYDTVAGTWHALSNQGLNNQVRALAAIGSDLYVGGYFTQTADGALTDLGCIARYDMTAGTWHALPNQGLDYVVWTMAVSGSDLYVGGDFSHTGDGALTDLGHIARYDTAAGAWHALPYQGLNGYVFVLAMIDGDLHTGGNFTGTGDGSQTDLDHIARYDPTITTWSGFPNQGLDNSVYALALVGSDLYVGGSFSQTGDGSLTNLGGMARYDTAAATWHALPNQGLSHTVHALAVVGSDLYVGGIFTQTADGALPNLGRIARYDITASAWYALPNQGFNGWVNELAVVGSDLYAAGYFYLSGDGALGLSHIARYDTWFKVYLPLAIRQ